MEHSSLLFELLIMLSEQDTAVSYSLTVKLHAKEGVIQGFGCSCTSTGEIRHINIPIYPINPASTEVVDARVSIVKYIIWQWSSRGNVVISETANLLKRDFGATGVHCDKRRKFDLQNFPSIPQRQLLTISIQQKYVYCHFVAK